MQRIHTRIHTIIHSSHTSKALHMQINASQRFVLHHEAVVASFNMSNDHQGLKAGPRRARGRLTSNRARGENADEPRVALTQSTPKQTGSSQPSRSILT